MYCIGEGLATLASVLADGLREERQFKVVSSFGGNALHVQGLYFQIMIMCLFPKCAISFEQHVYIACSAQGIILHKLQCHNIIWMSFLGFGTSSFLCTYLRHLAW